MIIVKERMINSILISRISVSNVKIKQSNVEIKQVGKSPRHMRDRIMNSKTDQEGNCIVGIVRNNESRENVVRAPRKMWKQC